MQSIACILTSLRTNYLVLSILVLAIGPTPAVGQNGAVNSNDLSVAIKMRGAKTSLPVAWTDEPAGTRGEPWYSPIYNDQAWPAGQLEEKDTVPAGKSKLWRIPLRVNDSPPLGIKTTLRLFGDDDLTVYFDGYLLGTYGDRKVGKQAGGVDIDLSDRLSSGEHLLAIRLDNVARSSRLSVQLMDFSSGSKERIRKDFWRNLTGKDEAAKRDTVLAIRRFAMENPDDSDLQLKVIYSYLHGSGELKDLKQAEQALTTYKTKFPISALEETAILKEIGKLELIIPRLRVQAEELKRFPDAPLRLGDSLRDMGDSAGAAEAYSKGFQISLTMGNVNLNILLDLAQRLLEAGKIEVVVTQLPRLEERVKQEGPSTLSARLGYLYDTIGDFDSANRCYVRYEQQGDTTATIAANYYRVKRAYNTGDFTYCLGLVETELKRQDLSSQRKEDYAVYRIRILSAQGKKNEAERACASIPWRTTDPGNQYYLFQYLRVARAIGNSAQIKAAADLLFAKLETGSISSEDVRRRKEQLVELAESYKLLGIQDRAVRYAKQLIENTPDVSLPSNQWMRGRAALVAGDKNLAIASLTKAKNLDPKNYWVGIALKQVTNAN